MEYEVTKQYPQGTFCWADMWSSDIEKTKAFMTKLMGWSVEDLPTDAGMDYSMFQKDGKNVAAASPISPEMEGMMPVWVCYVAVDDVDEMVEKAEKLGAKVKMPVMQVMKAGRMAGIEDPTGAQLFLWEAGEHIGASLVNTVGAMGWNELYTRDLVAAKEFYGDLFGWKYELMDDYTVIQNNGRSNGGMMEISKDWSDNWEQIPPHWMVYFTVESLDESMEQVKELGGSLSMEPVDAGDMRFVMVQEPSGAHFMIIELQNPPDEWVE